MATRDIAIYQPVEPGQPYTAALATLNSTGRQVTGAEKLLQRFLLELMTEQGSIPFAPTRGSTFLRTLRAGNMLTESDVISAFYVAMLNVTNNLQLEEQGTDENDERFGNAYLNSLTINPGQVNLNILIYNRANQLSRITLPVSFTPTPINFDPLD